MDSDHLRNLNRESDKAEEILAIQQLSDMETLCKLNGDFSAVDDTLTQDEAIQSVNKKHDAEEVHYDISSLSPQWVNFLESLREHHLAAIYALLAEEDAAMALSCIAQKALSQPNAILDEINEAAMQHIGDLILDAAFDPPVLISEYRPMLESCIYKENKDHAQVE